MIFIKTLFNYLGNKKIHKAFFYGLGALCVVFAIYTAWSFAWIYTNSDFTSYSLRAREMHRVNSLFPSTWNYGTDTTIWGLPFILFSLFPLIKNQVILLSISTTIIIFLTIFTLWLLDKYCFKNKSLILMICLIFLGGMNNDFWALFIQESLFQTRFHTFIAVIALFCWCTKDNALEFQKGKKKYIFLSLLILLTFQSLSFLQIYILPLFFSVFVIFLMANQKEMQLQKYTKTYFAVFLMLIATGIAVCINKLFVPAVTVMPMYVSNGTTNTLYSNVKDLLKSATQGLFCLEPNFRFELLSLTGIFAVLKIIFILTFSFILPILLLKKFKQLSAKVQFFTLSAVCYIILNLISTLFFLWWSAENIEPYNILWSVAHYFIISQLLLYILSTYYLQEFVLKNTVNKYIIFPLIFLFT
ncbi:MAG: hypothetical protein LBM93_11030, partial [Oscillospiraceae bacterium]|nr:hypothetical protein [Oscillospiraceae bacterium]